MCTCSTLQHTIVTQILHKGILFVDIDECTSDNDDCHSSLASCTNTVGSFSCSCNSPYTGNGRTCNLPQPAGNEHAKLILGKCGRVESCSEWKSRSISRAETIRFCGRNHFKEGENTRTSMVRWILIFFSLLYSQYRRTRTLRTPACTAVSPWFAIKNRNCNVNRICI